MNLEMVQTAVVAGLVQLAISWMAMLYLRSVVNEVRAELKEELASEFDKYETRLIRMETVFMERNR